MNCFTLTGASWRVREAQAKTWIPAVVPGCVHTDLIRAGRVVDPFHGTRENDLQWIEESDWIYQTDFSVPAELLREDTVELVADGLDTVAAVTLNGHEIARTENMFVAHRWSVRDRLRPGKNRIEIRFASALDYIRTHRTDHHPREMNDPVGRCTVIRKQQCQFGWDWGPRFVTAGIWRDLRLEAWSRDRLVDVRLAQRHRPDGSVTLAAIPTFALPGPDRALELVVSLDGREVARATGSQTLETTLLDARLWWPAGQGEQPLYQVRLEARTAAGELIGSWQRRIGLRTIVLDRAKDEWGESFRFVINGRPVFAKGANWIPAHAFVTTLTRADYARDLRAAVAAHMNMIRVWGGGIYESEDFYDLCDELGLLVWQDFMFACSVYPGDAAFAASVREEADTQIPRLRHRACLALWCGNNEVWGCNAHDLTAPEKTAWKAAYVTIFHEVLAKAVADHDPITPYWPSSPWRGDETADHAAGELRGDTHYWDVWHARHPVKDYEKHAFRFVSEFGMQSYSSPATNATFCPPDDTNVFGPSMENHQKNRAGNQIILDYVSRRYRFPKSQDDLIYLSQLNQGHCMQVGVEHYRRLMPRCMGALYWQLNDCWPVASWSSIEFTGRWKALHHLARRFNAPALVSAHVPGDETTIIGNYRRSTVDEVHLYTVYDAPAPARGLLRWDLFHLGTDGPVLGGRLYVALRPGESRRRKTLSLRKAMERHGRDNLCLRVALEIDGAVVSEDSVFLSPPRFLALRKTTTRVGLKMMDGKTAELSFRSARFQHRFAFDLAGVDHQASDNYFELFPNETRTVRVTLTRPATAARLRSKLTWKSLVDTY